MRKLLRTVLLASWAGMTAIGLETGSDAAWEFCRVGAPSIVWLLNREQVTNNETL